jgi:hypothetical protein
MHLQIPSGLIASSILTEWASRSAEPDLIVPEGTPERIVIIIEAKLSGSEGGPENWWSDAMHELSEVEAEAHEEGYQPPAEEAKQSAERILRSLSGLRLPAPSVYPTQDREVAIFFRNESRQASVLILCDSLGSGACFAFADGKGRRARYDDAGELPDSFIRAQLLKLI